MRTSHLKAVFPYLLLAVVSAVYLYPFIRGLNQAPDSGVFLYGADLVSQGALPSRDFIEPQGPGSFLWLAVFFRLFGATLETARTVLCATGVGLALFTFFLSRKLGASGVFATLFVLVISIPLLPINSPHYDSNLFALAALAIFLVPWKNVLDGQTPTAWKLIAPAMLCGLTTWMIQQKGLYLAAAFALCLVCQMRARALRPVATFLFAYGFMAALPILYSAAHNALPQILYANYIWPATTYSELNSAQYGFPIWQNLEATWSRQPHMPFTWLEDIAFSLPFLAVAALPFLVPFAARIGGKRWVEMPVLPFWLAAYAIWFSELHRMDMGHLRNGALLIAILFFAICEASTSKLTRRAGLIITASIVLAGTSQFLMSWGGEPHHARRGDLVVKENAALLEFLESRTRPGEEVFVYPYQPILYFVENLKNPTRYSYLLYHFHSNSQFWEATQDLERKKVRYVVVDSLLSGEGLASVFPAYKHPAKSQLIMEPYLESHYRLAKDTGRFRILERVEPPWRAAIR